MLILLLGFCLFITACGHENEGEKRIEEQLSKTEQSSGQLGGMTIEEINEWLGINAGELEAPEYEEVPENVILVAAMAKNYQDINEIINAFNKSQSEYRAEIKKYEERDAMLLDLVRGKGCDVLVLTSAYLTILSDKGALEDLTPYFEDSAAVSSEELFASILDAGTVGGRMTGVIPGFYVQAILVEKGYTDNGGWTLDEYLALMDKYPEVPLSKYYDPEDAYLWLTGELSELPDSFVDWDERTCSFESDEFIQAIEALKSYMGKGLKTEYNPYEMYAGAQKLYNRQVQTMLVNFDNNKYFASYKEIRDTFFEAYELAGFPNPEGEVKYPITAYGNVAFSINAASGKKAAAWQLLEYMLSEEYQQAIADSAARDFPVRRDILERKLQEEIEADPEDMSYRYTNSYTGEKVLTRGEFTEADKEFILYVLDHSAPPSVFAAMSSDFRIIFMDEVEAFFAGDKTAEEAAHNLQNRMSLYLTE